MSGPPKPRYRLQVDPESGRKQTLGSYDSPKSAYDAAIAHAEKHNRAIEYFTVVADILAHPWMVGYEPKYGSAPDFGYYVVTEVK